MGILNRFISFGIEHTWENHFKMSLKKVSEKCGLDSTGIG